MKKIVAMSALALVLLIGAGSAQAAFMPEVRDRFVSVQDSMSSVMEKFHTLINQADERGLDTTDAMRAYTAAKAKYEVAQTKVTELRAMFDSATGATPELRAKAQEAKTALMELRSAILEMRDEIRALIDQRPETNDGKDIGSIIPIKQ